MVLVSQVGPADGAAIWTPAGPGSNLALGFGLASSLSWRIVRLLKQPWSSNRVLWYGAMALPGAFLPSSAGVSLFNQYWTMGWPVPVPVTIYGPQSGFSGISMPFLPALLCGFVLWFAFAALSHCIWRWAHSGPPTVVRGFSAGIICAAWGLVLTFFARGAGELMLARYWMHTDGGQLLRCMTNFARVYPFVCLGFFSVPFALQFVVSRRFSLTLPRAAFCSVPVLLLAGLSSPIADSAQRMAGILGGGVLPIARPVQYCQGNYEMLLGLVYQVDLDLNTQPKSAGEPGRVRRPGR